MIKFKQFIVVVIVCIIVLCIVLGIYFIKKSNINEFNDALSSSKIEMIVLARDDCYWCEKFHPVLLELKNEKKIKYLYLKVNTLLKKDYDYVLNKLNIDSLGTPLTVLVQNGKVISKLEGYTTKEKLTSFLTTNGFLFSSD